MTKIWNKYEILWIRTISVAWTWIIHIKCIHGIYLINAWNIRGIWPFSSYVWICLVYHMAMTGTEQTHKVFSRYIPGVWIEWSYTKYTVLYTWYIPCIFFFELSYTRYMPGIYFFRMNIPSIYLVYTCIIWILDPVQVYLKRIGKAQSPICLHCWEGAPESLTHFACVCPKFREARTSAHNQVRDVITSLNGHSWTPP